MNCNLELRVLRVFKDALGYLSSSIEVTPEKNLVSDLSCDDLDNIEILMELEDEFDIEISDAEFGSLKTIADVIALIQSKTEAANNALSSSGK